MTKTRILWLLVVLAVLAVFAMQNWHYPDPPLQFLGFRFLPLPHALIIYSCFLLGFVVGWAAHALRVKKTKPEAPPASPPEPSPEA